MLFHFQHPEKEKIKCPEDISATQKELKKGKKDRIKERKKKRSITGHFSFPPGHFSLLPQDAISFPAS